MEPWHSPAGGEGGGSEGATPARGPQPAPPKLLTAPDTPVPQRPPLHLHQPHASPGPGHPPTPQATGPHARGPRQLGHALCRAELSGPTLCCPCAPLSSATHPLHEHLESTSLPGDTGPPRPCLSRLSPTVPCCSVTKSSTGSFPRGFCQKKGWNFRNAEDSKPCQSITENEAKLRCFQIGKAPNPLAAKPLLGGKLLRDSPR